MATITLPSAPGFSNVVPLRKRRSAISTSPWSLVQQVQRLPGDLWVATFTLPPMPEALGQEWIRFLDDLEGMSNTFNYDPNDWTRGSTGPGLIAWRLTSEDFQYTVSTDRIFSIQFEAMEAK